MNTYIRKTIWIHLIIGLTLILLALFAVKAYADTDVSSADIDAAYSYYSGTVDNSTTPPPENPNKNTRPVPPGGIGGIANNLMEPVTIMASLLVSVAFVVGFTCLFAAFVRYRQHRNNHLAHPISTPVILFILGILLLLLPLIYKFTESGIPFALH